MTERLSKKEKKHLKERFDDILNNQNDRTLAMTYAKWMPRWNEMCGGVVDWDDPRIQCERTLCNIEVIAILTDQKKPVEERRAKAYRYFPTDESWDVYLHGGQYGDGQPYTNIEKRSIMGHVVRRKK